MRTVLADREPAVRRALLVVLSHDVGVDVEVVAEVDSLVSLQSEVEASWPDLLVVDWDLLAPEPADALAALYRACPRLCVVVLGLRPESRDAALAAGADAFVSKIDAPDLVRRTLQASLAGVFARQPDRS
ncbi:MAG: hypothetical protein ACLQUT_01510 [Thermoleophilia bacterium]